MIGSQVLAFHPMAVQLLAAGNSGAHDSRLITFLKLNPFLSLTIGAVIVGAIAGLGLDKTLTVASVGISKMIASWVEGSTVSPLLLAWFVAVLIRLATGSATVATVTAAGILQPVTATLSTSHVSLLVLAIGAGSLFFSHVNDAGFWLTKQYFGLSGARTSSRGR
jgi:GntP family gluconate:H+ symporter